MSARINMITLAIGVTLLSSGAMAATTAGALTTTATVLSGCTIGSATMAFGVYDPTSATDTDATTTVAVVCTSGVPYVIYSTTALASRIMTTATGGAGQQLTVGVFGSTADRTAGNHLPTLSAAGTIAGTGTGLPQLVSLFGRLAALQNATPGAYTNALATTNLTVEY